MGLLDVASSASTWRGYEYCTEHKVLALDKVSDTEYMGIVRGSEERQYTAFINVEHPRKSHCDCPFAAGRRVVCKHQIALYFTAFPKAAQKYKKEVDKYEEEQQYRAEHIDELVEAFINKQTKAQLREILMDVLYDSSDWTFDNFVCKYIEQLQNVIPIAESLRK